MSLCRRNPSDAFSSPVKGPDEPNAATAVQRARAGEARERDGNLCEIAGGSALATLVCGATVKASAADSAATHAAATASLREAV
mmetsp:Transcript_40464/g.79277  ORF Transcript_40464/g.79277 Transcript_40464/m.79277 type:complete len:84 (-) Transcript_40464:92-343(-)